MQGGWVAFAERYCREPGLCFLSSQKYEQAVIAGNQVSLHGHELDLQVVLHVSSRTITRISPDLFDPGAYDVYIIGDVPAAAFEQEGVDLLDDWRIAWKRGAVW